MNHKLSNEQIEIVKNIKLIITDVDGVLTDGGLYYTNEGLVMKKFNVKDGMGFRLLREAGIESGIITTDVSELVKTRAERIKADFIFIGVWDKEVKMKELCIERDILPASVAFIGDDVNDMGIIRESGFSASPSDAVEIVMNSVDLVLNKKGGEGVFREFADLILNYRK